MKNTKTYAEFKQQITEKYEPSIINLDDAFYVISTGGSVGARNLPNQWKGSGGGRVVATFNDKKDAHEKAKSLRKTLSPGEKSYYRMGYKTVPGNKKNVGMPEDGQIGENVQDAAFNLDKIFGDDQESIETFQDIEDNGTVKDMIHYIEEWGDEDMLARYGIKTTAHIKKLAKHIMKESVNEDTVYGKKFQKVMNKIPQWDWLSDDPGESESWEEHLGIDRSKLKDYIILYSYANDNWNEVKKLLDKARIKYDEMDDPDTGEATIVFKVNESLNEDVYDSFLKDLTDGEIIDAHSDGAGVDARSTQKVWDDGVPVLKYIGRAPIKAVKVPKGKLKVVADNKFGWWYFKIGNTWYGIHKDDYDRLPFDY